MVNTIILSLAAVLLILGALVARRGLRLAGLMNDLRTLPETPLDRLRPGLVRTHGFIDAEETMTAPLSGKPSVYHFVKAENEPAPGTKPRRLATHKAWTPSQVRFDETRIDLEPWTPLVASGHETQHRFAGLTRVPAEHAQLFEDLGIQDHHAARLGTLVVTEYRFEPGDAVHVTGTYQPHKGIYRRERNPFIVSAFEDVGYLHGLRNELLIYAAVAPMLLAAALVVGILAFA